MPGQHYRRLGDSYLYDKRTYPTIDDCVILTEAQFEDLPEYSSSIPTGVFANKQWRYRHMTKLFRGSHHRLMTSPDDVWFIREYVEIPGDPDRVKITSCPIVLDSQLAALAIAVFWWLP
jgi:hypothetical protein